MEVIFFWNGEGDTREPGCVSSMLSQSEIDFLACLLTDHGGQNYRNTIGWLDEGLSRVTAVRSGVVKSSDWSRDSWGVSLEGKVAKIYSLYDEECYLALAIQEFERILLGWRDFISWQNVESP
ncbi:hypothetical protein ACILG0_06405 [Pseudomonadota bacterium AL_CKDN230030165-1A_HGKHYDSX7]